MALEDIETSKGIVSTTLRPTSSVLSGNGNTPGPINHNGRETAASSPLQLFQWLVGIHTPPCLEITSPSNTRSGNVGLFQRIKQWFVGHTPPPLGIASQSNTRRDNVGLYQRTRDQERISRLSYIVTSCISNTPFLVQIMLAAAFTGLSAYKEANAVTLTILGAFNTVVAGCLAWQKGQGVPQRYRKAQDAYQALILEIEMRERAFIDLETSNRVGDVQLNPRDEAAKLEKMFETARADQQANYPDLYISTGASTAKASQQATQQVDDAKAEATKQLDDAKAQAAKVQSDLTQQLVVVQTAAAKMQSDLIARIEDMERNLVAKVATHAEAKVDEMSKKQGS